MEPIKRRNKPVQWELEQQILLFEERDRLLPKYPLLRWGFAGMTGVYIPPGVKRVVRAGLVKGVLDIWIMVPRRLDPTSISPGLVMDLKTPRQGHLKVEQQEWASYLRQIGFQAEFPPDAITAWRLWCDRVGITGKDREAESLAAACRQWDALREASKR